MRIFSLQGKIPVVTMVRVVSRFSFKAPPGISSSCISPLISSGQRSRASWVSQPQKSAALSPQPGGKSPKFIRICGALKKNVLLIISISCTCLGRLFRTSSGTLDCVCSLRYNEPTMLPAGEPLVSTVGALYHKLQTQSSASENGPNYSPKHVEVIEIINIPLFLHLFGYLYYCIREARSHKRLICASVFEVRTLGLIFLHKVLFWM